jgi:hypothetical protein
LSSVALGPVPRQAFGDHEATTRKVTDPQESAQPPVMAVGTRIFAILKGLQSWHAVVIAVAIAGSIVLAAGMRKRVPLTVSPPKTTSVPAVAVPVVLPGKANLLPEPVELPKPEQPLPSRKTVRLEIGVEPAEATLTLDGETVGNQLAIDAPEDQRLHELRASAPGFLGFSQKIGYSSDVHLAIQLRPLRASARAIVKPHIAKSTAKSQARIIGARPVIDVRPSSVSVKMDAKTPFALPETEEPGVNLGHPSQRRTSKPIDEKDPYAQ